MEIMGDERNNGFWIVAACFYQLLDILISHLQLFSAQDKMGLADVWCLFGLCDCLIHRDVWVPLDDLPSIGLAREPISGS